MCIPIFPSKIWAKRAHYTWQNAVYPVGVLVSGFLLLGILGCPPVLSAAHSQTLPCHVPCHSGAGLLSLKGK